MGKKFLIYICQSQSKLTFCAPYSFHQFISLIRDWLLGKKASLQPYSQRENSIIRLFVNKLFVLNNKQKSPLTKMKASTQHDEVSQASSSL